MLCREIMNRDVECIDQEQTIAEAARIMKTCDIGFLPVCDGSLKVIGTITDRDIAIRLVAENKPLDTKVALVMTNEVVHCKPEDDLQLAENLMGESQVSRILCLDSKD